MTGPFEDTPTQVCIVGSGTDSITEWPSGLGAGLKSEHLWFKSSSYNYF